MKQLKNALLGLACIVMLATACHTKGKKEQVEAFPLDSLTLVRTIPLSSQDSEAALSLRIEYIYPKQEDSLTQAMNRYLFGDTIEESTPEMVLERYAKVIADDYQAGYNAEKNGFLPAELFNANYTFYNDFVFQDADLVSVEVCVGSYEGGAHPANLHTYYNIDRKTYQRITEGDIFVEHYQTELSPILAKLLMEDYNVNSEKELEETVFFNTEEIAPNGNFSIDQEGLTYCFNEYQVAASTYGPVYVFVPYKRIAHLIKPDSPLRKYLSSSDK